MIDLFSWSTPNGRKLHIALEELGLPYAVHAVDINAGEQFRPEFLAISPNNKIPAMIDQDGPGGKPIAVFESGAMLIYLAEKTGRLMPSDARGRYEVMQWLMFQMGTVGPMLGQANHFRLYAKEKIAYAIERYTNEAARIYGVLDDRLEDRDYVAGDYSIADIAIFPWLRVPANQGQNLDDFPNLKRWFETIARRPAVERGVAVLVDKARSGPLDERAREVLYGATQYKRHGHGDGHGA
jgi:GST-like protein